MSVFAHEHGGVDLTLGFLQWAKVGLYSSFSYSFRTSHPSLDVPN